MPYRRLAHYARVTVARNERATPFPRRSNTTPMGDSMVQKLTHIFGLGALCVNTFACSAEVLDDTATAEGALKTYSVDIRRSLAVTDQQILAGFSLQRVMNQLAAQSGIAGLTATQLFQDWWQTQNSRAPGDTGPITHCDDAALSTALNGYPYDCRPAPSEGFQSNCDPFAANSTCAYIPIGLFNRFDQAPEDGSHCGEHRIVYAKATGVTDNSNRNLLIFEFNMANPHPVQGIKGCKQIVDVWADLTAENDIQDRADALEEFYFDGHANLPPVVSVSRLGDNPGGLGQVRTNQFVFATTGWQLREFKLMKDCSVSPCTLLFEPVTNKVNAFGPLFDPASVDPHAAAFVAHFPTQVAALAATTLNGIGMAVPDTFNTGRSISSAAFNEMKYLVQLGPSASPLRTAIQAELTTLGSTLTVDEIALRAQTTSCAGCHRLNNNVAIGGGLTWPSASGFVHVDERTTETVQGSVRYIISPALQDVFLPHRKTVIDDFLNNKPKVPRGPKVALGGSTTHG
jgi:hypothetical protein